MKPVYLISSASISAQHTYNEADFLHPVLTSDDGKLFVTDPDYTRYISPVAIRRMSRMLKRGITAGMRCLEDAGIKTPDGIIIGTSHGSVTDMELFLHDMINLQETALNPTTFIQSTYNSVNGWLAMLSKCSGYNQTFVHRGFSLELCLLDARMMLDESSDKMHLLVGGFDELTNEYYSIRCKIDYFKANPSRSTDLLGHRDTIGSVGGEGAHFFTLSNEPGNAACALHGLEMLHTPTDAELTLAIEDLLSRNGLSMQDLDVVLSGANGDSRTDHLAQQVSTLAAERTTVATFKQLSGEYDTASGFALWLADYMFRRQLIPAEVIVRKGSPGNIRNIMICNITIAGNVSLMLLRSAT